MQPEFLFLSEELQEVAAGNGWTERFLPDGTRVLEHEPVSELPPEPQPE